MRSDTQTISIDAPPTDVLALVGDPMNLPRWAPDFARAVRAEGEHWLVDTGGGELRIRVRVSEELGTMDLLAPEADIGAFTRVVANGKGSEFGFTQFFPAEMDAAAVDRQTAVVGEELETVKTLSESR